MNFILLIISIFDFVDSCAKVSPKEKQGVHSTSLIFKPSSKCPYMPSKPFDYQVDFVLSPLAQALIEESKEMKRLASVAQLGLVHTALGFEGHSRLEHSIGVAKLARIFVGKIIQNSGFSLSDLDQEEINALEIAGLMHDVGHGPFSHTFETLKLGPKDWHHEEESGKIIRDVLPEFAKKYGIKDCDAFVEKVDWLVTRHGEMPRFEHPWISDIINSTGGYLNFDVDRCDYLMRDSCYCNKVICEIYPEIHSKIQKCVEELMDNCKIESITDDKIHVSNSELVEKIKEFRSFMFENVYLHEKVKTAEEKLAKKIKSCKDKSKLAQTMDDFEFMEALEEK